MRKLIVVLLVPAALAACKDDPKPEAKSEPSEPETQKVPDQLLANQPSEAFVYEQLTFKPIAGHHFELKAPQDCGGYEFESKSPMVMRCQLGAPGEHKIRLSICDDAKAYCKPVEFSVNAKAGKGFVEKDVPRKVVHPPKEKEPVEGFIMNKPDEAVAGAKSKDSLLFIHFYGIWCPPCNQLEENVYSQDAFKDATKDMVRLMMDADSDVSWDMKSKFKVGGYPTVIIANADLEEIDRVVGYREPGAMQAFITDAKTNKDVPVSMVAQDAPDKTSFGMRRRVGKWHYERGEYEVAEQWLQGMDGEARKYLLMSQERQAQKLSDSEAQLKAVKALAKEFPNEIEFAGWVEEIVQADEEAGKALAPAAFKNIETWMTSAELPHTGYSKADLAWYKASLHDALGDKDAAKAAYLESAAFSEEAAKSSNLSTARGANMDRAYALYKAGENEQAKKLYQELVAAYPEEFSFNYNYASILNKLEEYEESYKFVQVAQQHAYGDNALRAAHLRAKVELKLEKPDDAKKTIDEALANATVPKSTAVRTHRYIANLRTLRSEIH